MRKCFLFIVVSVLASVAGVQAQVSLFSAPDTVCVKQPIQLVDSVKNANSYLWSLCSGNVKNAPTITNLGSIFGFKAPSAIEVIKDGGRFYAFVTNRGNNTLTRLDFGRSLSNAPIVTPLGILNNTVPDTPAGIYALKVSGSWFLFVTGGTNLTNSSLSRFDFGSSLGNTPNSVNFGNLDNALHAPRGLFIAQEGSNYFGYILNSDPANTSIVRVSFGSNISNTPSLEDLGNIGALDQPYDLAPVYNNGNWTFYVTNTGSGTISKLDLVGSLAALPTGSNQGTIAGKLNEPTGITSIRDCDSFYLFVNNRGSDEMLRVSLPSNGSIPTTASSVQQLGLASGKFNFPTGLSSVVRDSADVYLFAVNAKDSSLTSVRFPGCSRVSRLYSTAQTPPTFSYDTAGTYTVYFTADEGMATMRTECKQIVVQPIPGINISNDTLICQGDTIRLVAQSVSAVNQLWIPNYNITSNTANTVRAYPEYTLRYRIVFNYSDGCVVDTGINVRVNKNNADAGPDRVISDGAQTLLGGPGTTAGPGYSYRWFPANYLDDPYKANPTAFPVHNYTYYLTVTYKTDELTCNDIDSVVVMTQCADLYLPNAFAPGGGNASGSNRFGLLNRQIVKLNYFRVFDRWGQEVFSTTDITKEWDGTRNGDPALQGVYIWEADGFCSSGQRLKRSGNVTLLR
jgi:hypothetical protein